MKALVHTLILSIAFVLGLSTAVWAALNSAAINPDHLPNDVDVIGIKVNWNQTAQQEYKMPAEETLVRNSELNDDEKKEIGGAPWGRRGDNKVPGGVSGTAVITYIDSSGNTQTREGTITTGGVTGNIIIDSPGAWKGSQASATQQSQSGQSQTTPGTTSDFAQWNYSTDWKFEARFNYFPEGTFNYVEGRTDAPDANAEGSLLEWTAKTNFEYFLTPRIRVQADYQMGTIQLDSNFWRNYQAYQRERMGLNTRIDPPTLDLAPLDAPHIVAGYNPNGTNFTFSDYNFDDYDFQYGSKNDFYLRFSYVPNTCAEGAQQPSEIPVSTRRRTGIIQNIPETVTAFSLDPYNPEYRKTEGLAAYSFHELLNMTGADYERAFGVSFDLNLQIDLSRIPITFTITLFDGSLLTFPGLTIVLTAERKDGAAAPGSPTMTPEQLIMGGIVVETGPCDTVKLPLKNGTPPNTTLVTPAAGSGN